VTLAEAKSHLRVEHDEEDSDIRGLIAGAEDWFQQETGRQFVDKTFIEYRDNFANTMQLPHPPLDSVTSIVYVDTSGTTQTLATATYCVVDTDVEPGEVRLAYGQSWPALRGTPERDVRITYKAGYGASGDEVPHSLKTGVKMLAGHWYEHREAASDGRPPTEIPLGVQAIAWQYKVPGADS